MNNNKCPKCGGEMEEGVMVDVQPGSLPGPLGKQKWATKIKWGGIGGIENAHELRTFRCKSCGFLESYAK